MSVFSPFLEKESFFPCLFERGAEEAESARDLEGDLDLDLFSDEDFDLERKLEEELSLERELEADLDLCFDLGRDLDPDHDLATTFSF